MPDEHRPSRPPARILYVEANEDGTVGGSHRGLVDLVTGLDRARFEPVVLFYQSNRHVDALRTQGIEVHTWDEVCQAERRVRLAGGVSKYRDVIGAVLRRAAVLREWRITLVHMNNSPLVGFDDWLPAAVLRRIPCITFAMGDAQIGSAVHRFMARRFDHVVTISRYMHEAMLAVGIPESRLTLAHLGVDVAALRAAVHTPRDAMREALGVATDEVFVVMVANIRDWKGQHVLVDALDQMPAAVRNHLQVRFVGAESLIDAEYRSGLDARIAAAGLGSRVRFIGPRDDVPAIYAAADIAVHSSTRPEPFGLVVPEAMAQGTPVIASRFGGPGEVITPDCGRTFDPARPAELAEHLTLLAGDASLRRRLGHAASQRVTEFSVRAMVERIEGVYDRLLLR